MIKKNKTDDENVPPNKSEIDESSSVPTITVERNSDSTIDTEEPATSVTSGKAESK